MVRVELFVTVNLLWKRIGIVWTWRKLEKYREVNDNESRFDVFIGLKLTLHFCLSSLGLSCCGTFVLGMKVMISGLPFFLSALLIGVNVCSCCFEVYFMFPFSSSFCLTSRTLFSLSR